MFYTNVTADTNQTITQHAPKVEQVIPVKEVSKPVTKPAPKKIVAPQKTEESFVDLL